MAEGRISLTGFSLEPAEKAIVDNLIRNYKNKIQGRIVYKEIKLHMKKAVHGKVYLHKVQGTLITDKIFSAKVEDYNLFAAIAEVMEKLMHEAEHNQRKFTRKDRE